MKIRWKAQNAKNTHGYYVEPYTVQHAVDKLLEVLLAIPKFAWFVFRHFTSKKYRVERAREYNRLMFGSIPTSQIYVTDSQTGELRTLREDERTWPE